MKRSLSAAGLVLAALLTVHCAGAPTAPTPVITSDLRWDVVAQGCAPASPVPNLTERPETRTATATGVTARWLVLQTPDDSLRRYIVGDFRPVGAVFGICTWSTLERRVDR